MRSSGSPETIGSQYHFHIAASLIIAVVVAAIYSNTLDASFHLDDYKQITGNEALRNLDNLFSILTAPKRGVANATFALNYALGGQELWGYHIVNIAIHILNSILVYFLLFFVVSSISSLRGRAKRIAFFIALLFAVHPVQTGAVTYITQRQESMSALFCLTSLIFFVLALRSNARVKAIVFYAAIPICYLLAFYSKEIAMTLPALIFLFDLYFAGVIGGKGRRGWLQRWPLHAVMAILLIFFVVTSISALGGLSSIKATGASSVNAQVLAKSFSVSAAVPLARAEEIKAKGSGQMPTAGFGVEGLGPKEYLFTQLNVHTYYMALLLVPLRQNIDYDFPISSSLFATPHLKEGTKLLYAIPPPVVSLLIIIAIIAAALYLARRSFRFDVEGEGNDGARGRIASYFILWFFIVLSPTSSFIPVIDVIFEHRLYLASLGFFVTAVLLIDWFSSSFFRDRNIHDL